MNLLSPLFIRKWSPTQIQYILISRHLEKFSYIFPPEEFDNAVLDFVKQCPKDLLQLVDPMHFYELSYRYAFNNPIYFSVVYDINIEKFLDDFIFYQNIKLFFIDAKSPYLHKIIEGLQKIHKPTHFYLVFNQEKGKDITIENSVENPEHFMTKLLIKQSEILAEFEYKNVTLAPFVNKEYKDLIAFDSFSATQSNYWMINNLIGNFQFGNNHTEQESENKIEKTSADSIKAVKNGDSFERQQVFIDQIMKLDAFIEHGLAEKIFTLNNGTEPVLSPLLLIAPYHNPDIKKLYPSNDPRIKDFIKASLLEQTRNYTSSPEQKLEPVALLQALKNQQMVSRFLDNMAFLHASNSYSPIIRLPLKGGSINRELSFFRTETFSGLANIKVRRNINTNIERFGAVYKHKSISPAIEQLIVERNGQIVLLSDLPLEWLTFDKVPFAFTHDICRMPVIGYRGIMANYASNLLFEYKVPPSIMQKTLVIFGNSSPEFKAWQDPCEALAKEKGFTTIRCKTIKEVKESIEKYRPEFLVFDCHGSYDKTNGSTYLMIGNEMLTGEVVLANKIVAPIVFLSACGTAPTYGSVNTIANAFLEIGCFTVTTTYLPVEINSSSVLYLRLLNKLGIAAEKGLHKNWLEFVCHVVRTEHIMERYRLAIRKSPAAVQESLAIKATEALTDSLLFSRRKDVHSQISEQLLSISGLKENSFDNIMPEYLFYSHLGRADLIYFSRWLSDFRRKNDMKEPENE